MSLRSQLSNAPHLIRTRIGVPFVLLALFAALIPGGKIQASGTTATITVSSTATGTLQTQMSTNNVWSGMLDQTPGAQTRFNALHLPLVRLHVGDDGYPEAMPEIKQGQWDFSALDTLVNDVTQTGQQPLMNIKFAPDWMWTCYPNSIGVSSNGTQGTGTVADLTFQPFAQYMARLVSYYNKGSMTTESGTVITNPAGTKNRITYWELWNEPDGNWETPCAPPNGEGITPAQYVTMWNAVTKAMLAVDPTLKFVGPTVANGQHGSGPAYNDYITDLINGAQVQPVAISFHEYGYWDNSVPDQTLFDGDGSSSGSGGIYTAIQDVKAIRAAYPSYPIWITEANVNGAWGNDPYSRPWTALGAAWWGSFFSQLAPLGVAYIHQFDLIDAPQFGLINQNTGGPFLPYWEISLLNSAFPSGSTLLSASSTKSDIQTLAVKKPNGDISVLVVNRQVNSSTTKGGTGLAATVGINLQGITPTSITLQQIDSTTSVSTGPATTTVPVSTSPQVSFGGYGMAVLTISTSGASQSAPTATSTTVPTATPTATTVPTSGSGTAPTATATATATKVPTATPTATKAPTATPTATKAPTATATATTAPTSGSGTAPTATATATTSSTSGLTVYSNSVSSVFKDNSFGFSSRNAQDSSTYVSAPYSYGVTYNSYGALEFIPTSGTINPANYKALEYNINTNGQALKKFGVTISDSNGNWINEVALSSANVTQTLSGGWVHVKLPLSTLDAAGTSIKYLDIDNETTSSLSKIWVDDVQFSS